MPGIAITLQANVISYFKMIKCVADYDILSYFNMWKLPLLNKITVDSTLPINIIS